MVALCQYHAQLLCTPRRAVVPCRTSLDHGYVDAHMLAVDLMRTCGFALPVSPRSHICTLAVSTADFRLQKSPDLPFKIAPLQSSSAVHMLFAMFEIYALNGHLGHPDTLKRIFDLLPAAGLTQVLHGYADWTPKAHSLARRLRQNNDSLRLWPTDLHDTYIAEAQAQWTH